MGAGVAFAVGAGNDAPGGGGGPQPGGAAPAAHAATGIAGIAARRRWMLRALRRGGESGGDADLADASPHWKRENPALVSPNDSAYS
mmetsp:Transcript_26513/g.77807  ORF Transcript_26513/g.77807 Transcript_26513/m.77807 type:complete len:87 (+) Transcript_26513:890-1150(+)